MSHQPTFRALYHRSRFDRSDDDATSTGTGRQYRRELFAVAVVAFVLKHDVAFRNHFLEQICEAPAGTEIEIKLQPRHHSDLAITIPKRGVVWVIEFKFGSKLADIQNPLKPEFFSEEASGYGHQIEKEPLYCGFKKAYVVIDQEARFKPGSDNALSWKSCTWAQLLPNQIEPIGLWLELLDSLGELGIVSFQARKHNGMKIAKYTRGAVHIFTVIQALANELRLDRRSDSYNVAEEDGKFWFGLEIPAGARSFTDLGQRSGTTSGKLGWFGFQEIPAQDTESGSIHELAVWIYCASISHASDLSRHLNQKLSGLGCTAEQKDNDIEIKTAETTVSAAGSLEWFHKVFKAVGALA